MRMERTSGIVMMCCKTGKYCKALCLGFSVSQKTDRRMHSCTIKQALAARALPVITKLYNWEPRGSKKLRWCWEILMKTKLLQGMPSKASPFLRHRRACRKAHIKPIGTIILCRASSLTMSTPCLKASIPTHFCFRIYVLPDKLLRYILKTQELGWRRHMSDIS